MKYVHSYDDTWGAPRPQGGHEGTDLMTPAGTPEYAVTDSTVVPVTGSNGNGWNTLGGYTVMLRAAYSVGPVREGDLFYYAHLDQESALPLGTRVRAGQMVGYAGDTGQGPEVTRGLFPPHLHFGWYDATGTRSFLPSGAMNPYPLLEWIGAGGGVLGGGSKARYCEVPRSGAPTPSTGPDRWPAARNDGARPDLDTGIDSPAPGPVAGNGARAHEPQTGRAGKPSPTYAGSPAKASSDAPGKAAPEPGPRAPKPSASDAETPDKPPPPGSRAPNSPPENEPPQEGDDHPDIGRGPQDDPETGKGEDADKDPAGGPEAGSDESKEPEGEKPEEEKAQPGEETTPDDSASQRFA